MTSEQFVWVWLAGAADPVVCGRVWRSRDAYFFQYGASYLGRADAVPLYGLPLGDSNQAPPPGVRLHGALRDGLPDAWGQHVILARLTGRSGAQGDTGDLDEITCMRESASDRFGALDFQDSSTAYVARQEPARLDDLADAALALEEGRQLAPALQVALAHGTTIGGARPKAMLVDAAGDSWIAKFSSASDGGRPLVRHEALALDLARAAGATTVDFRLTTAAGRDALLVRRFDRIGGARVMAVSALTLLELDELAGRYATYPDLRDALVACSTDPVGLEQELFTRIVANIVLGNTDDHARNHAALWDGRTLELSPAYDLDPCRPPGWDANQAMAYGRDGERRSNLADLVRSASAYGLTRAEARGIVDRVVTTVRDQWADALDRAHLTRAQGDSLFGSRILNPAILAD